MLELLQTVDTAVFYFINNTLSNSVFDKFFVYITDVNHWYLVYVILWGIAFFKGGRMGKIAAIGSLLVITAADQLSSSLLKNMIERVRPCNALPHVNILVGCTGSFSMPSSHAVNNFAIATFFSQIYPKLTAVLYIAAFLVAFSRPYVGVHYPGDIFVGAIVGIIVGLTFAYLALQLEKHFKTKELLEDNQ